MHALPTFPIVHRSVMTIKYLASQETISGPLCILQTLRSGSTLKFVVTQTHVRTSSESNYTQSMPGSCTDETFRQFDWPYKLSDLQLATAQEPFSILSITSCRNQNEAVFLALFQLQVVEHEALAHVQSSLVRVGLMSHRRVDMVVG